jgi:hypothetical protein
MINCAHPAHFANVLPAGAPWAKRVRGVRARKKERAPTRSPNRFQTKAVKLAILKASSGAGRSWRPCVRPIAIWRRRGLAINVHHPQFRADFELCAGRQPC